MDRAPDQDTPWSELTDHALSLGDTLRETYRRVADENGPSEEEIRDAFATLGAAWTQMADIISAALADERVREQAKRAGLALWSAISASFAQHDEAGEGE